MSDVIKLSNPDGFTAGCFRFRIGDKVRINDNPPVTGTIKDGRYIGEPGGSCCEVYEIEVQDTDYFISANDRDFEKI